MKGSVELERCRCGKWRLKRGSVVDELDRFGAQFDRSVMI